jgi:hypothetical protein
VLHWDWNAGVAVLDWITSQHECDRATAVFALCSGAPGEVATRRDRREDNYGGFVRALAARLEGGFYPNAELGLDLTMRQRAAFEVEIETARLTGVSPWRLPDGLLDHEGRRIHRPRYAVTDGRVRYHYEYWLEHLAPKR